MEIKITMEQLSQKTKMIICLPGRGQNENEFKYYLDFWWCTNGLGWTDKPIIEEIHPGNEWYPLPNGPNDQISATLGIKKATESLFSKIKILSEKYNILFSEISLLGFSAGGVMALQIAANTNEKFHSVVCHSGAILEPDKLPQAMSRTPILLVHRTGDDCFSWEERYLPMKRALLEKNYYCNCLEINEFGHGYTSIDMNMVVAFINGLHYE